MPSNIKAGLSVVALIVAAIFAYYEWTTGRVDLAWVTIGTGIFMVVAMWIFPEAAPKAKRVRSNTG